MVVFVAVYLFIGLNWDAGGCVVRPVTSCLCVTPWSPRVPSTHFDPHGVGAPPVLLFPPERELPSLSLSVLHSVSLSPCTFFYLQAPLPPASRVMNYPNIFAFWFLLSFALSLAPTYSLSLSSTPFERKTDWCTFKKMEAYQTITWTTHYQTNEWNLNVVFLLLNTDKYRLPDQEKHTGEYLWAGIALLRPSAEAHIRTDGKWLLSPIPEIRHLPGFSGTFQATISEKKKETPQGTKVSCSWALLSDKVKSKEYIHIYMTHI